MNRTPESPQDTQPTLSNPRSGGQQMMILQSMTTQCFICLTMSYAYDYTYYLLYSMTLSNNHPAIKTESVIFAGLQGHWVSRPLDSMACMLQGLLAYRAFGFQGLWIPWPACYKACWLTGPLGFKASGFHWPHAAMPAGLQGLWVSRPLDSIAHMLQCLLAYRAFGFQGLWIPLATCCNACWLTGPLGFKASGFHWPHAAMPAGLQGLWVSRPLHSIAHMLQCLLGYQVAMAEQSVTLS